jgi:hypothetical protein
MKHKAVQQAAEQKPERGSSQLPTDAPADLCVDLDQPWEVRHWCKQFSCTEQQLRDAVTSVGVLAANVKRALASTLSEVTRRR